MDCLCPCFFHAESGRRRPRAAHNTHHLFLAEILAKTAGLDRGARPSNNHHRNVSSPGRDHWIPVWRNPSRPARPQLPSFFFHASKASFLQRVNGGGPRSHRISFVGGGRGRDDRKPPPVKPRINRSRN